jgi:hypothetical protein
MSRWEAGENGALLAALNLDTGGTKPLTAELKGWGPSYGRDPLGRYLCLSDGELWLDLHTGEPVTGAPALADYVVAGSIVSFGPDGLVLVNGGLLGRIHEGTFERIGRRRWTASEDRWNERATDLRTGGTSFIGDRRVLVHAYGQRDGLVPVILDFGPATCRPIAGTPDDILKSWCERLALQLTSDGEIAPQVDR